jgi:hypothetical protein
VDGDEDFLAGIGECDKFAKAGFGFSETGDHVTTMVLFLKQIKWSV